MKDTYNSEAAIICQKTEGLLKEQPLYSAFQLSDSITLKLIHELETSQQKLKMLNGELRLARDQARVAINKYSELYDSTQSGYITVSKDGKLIELNNSAARMLERNPSQLKNKQLGSYFSNESKLKFSQFLNNIFFSNAKESCIVNLLSAKNQLTIISLTGVAIGKGEYCLITINDIIEDSLAANEASTIHQKLDATLVALRDVFFEIDMDGICYDFHSPNVGHFNIVAKDVIGKTLSDFFSPFVSEVVMLATKEAQENGFSVGRQIEMEFLRVTYWFEISVSRKINATDKPHFIILMRDISERKRAKETVRKKRIVTKEDAFKYGGCYCNYQS